MNEVQICSTDVGGVIRSIEETVEAANLLALEMAISALENEMSADLGSFLEIADRARAATGEMERLVREARPF